jgi:CRISPR-associated protein Cmr2
MPGYLMAVALGPVQDFISAARRTRDLWFGSRLLSDISKVAARAIQNAGGNLIFPSPEALDDSHSGVANVILAKLPERLAPPEARRLAHDAAAGCWNEYADRARTIAADIINKQIWDAQSKADDVIEFYAAAVPLESDEQYASARQRVMRLLAGRKVCRDFQAVEGYRLPKSSLDGARETVLRRRDKNDKALEAAYKSLEKRLRLLPGEQLDTIGMTKRLAGGERYPSVSRLAADPWLRGIAARAPERLAGLRAICESLIAKGLTRVEGKRYEAFLYEGTAVYRNRLHELGEETGEPKESYAMLDAELQALEREFGEPDPYMAVLAADGDKMGAAISANSDSTLHCELSKQLAAFARKAREIVESERYRGTLVYSGGDDVLAFVPVDTCLACARELHDEFGKRLKQFHGPTLSVGIAIGHFLESLEDLLGRAREAERDAKGKDPDKDGLAVHIHPRGGALTAVRAKWGELPDLQLQRLVEMHALNEIPDKAAYDLRQLALDYTGWPHKTNEEQVALDEAIRADVKRLMKRKRVANPEVWDTVLVAGQGEKRWTAEGVRSMAERIIVARRIHASRRQASGQPAAGEATV